MTRPYSSTYRYLYLNLSLALTRLLTSGALILAAAVLVLAFCAPSQAGAQTRRTGAHTHGASARVHKAHSHGAGARARKASCASAHAKRGARTCSAKGHGHKTKTAAHHKHATGSRHAQGPGKVRSPAPAAPAGSPGTTCPDGVNATLDEEGSFACAGGAEPGCQEGFSPVVSDDGSTLICESEQNEAGGEEEAG
jgi:hypothetical protein